MNITFKLGRVHDIDEIEQLYNDLNDYLAKGVNYPGWIKDVYEGNIPAINLYEKCGFKYIDTVDLGLGNYGLNWFRLYEKLLCNHEHNLT